MTPVAVMTLSVDRDSPGSPYAMIYMMLCCPCPAAHLCCLSFGDGPAKDQDERVTTFCRDWVEEGGLSVLAPDSLRPQDTVGCLGVALLSGLLPHRRRGELLDFSTEAFQKLIEAHDPKYRRLLKDANEGKLGSLIRELPDPQLRSSAPAAIN